MKYILMHKEIPVILLDYDDEAYIIGGVEEVYNKEHLPIGVHSDNKIVNRVELNEWWYNRSIPSSRIGLHSVLDVLDIHFPQALLHREYGLSLSDQYWMRPADCMDVRWADINFFDHLFSEEFGALLLGKEIKSDTVNFRSPDITTNGCLKKCWQAIGGKCCLIKGGSNPFVQQPFNEVVAALIAEALKIDHVPYWVIWDDGKPYSVCENFITKDTEFVSAWQILKTVSYDGNTDLFDHYLNCCEVLGLVDITRSISQMMVLDYIMANGDRHFNNFGFIRNAETLEWIGVAPIFDSGSSLGYDKLPAQILSGKDVECKPFKKRHEEQLRLVTDYSWINFAALETVDMDIRNVFKEAGMYADENRIEAVVSSVKRRISNLQALAAEKAAVIDNIEDDVIENIAEDYVHDDDEELEP